MLPCESDSQIRSQSTSVIGVVHPHGCGGKMESVDSGWTLRFSFETWRDASAILHSDELVITRQVTSEELRTFMNCIQPYDILMARVVFTGSQTANLVELLQKPADQDYLLVERLIELQKPKIREHEHFGTLTLDRRYDWYEATVGWLGKEIQLYLWTVDDSELKVLLQNALEIWDEQLTWNSRIQDYCTQELLDLKNTVWLGEDETCLTSDDFKSHMKLESIKVSPNGVFEFMYDDGGLFFGHAIWIKGNFSDGPERVELFG